MIVAGAGPAGSVAAASLAARGLRVMLCDRSAFPRDKTCGDALIADALGALDRLGLGQRVAARARTSSALDVMAPSGARVALPGILRVLPRRELDAMLLEHAVDCGAEFHQLSVEGPVVDGDAVAGVSVADSAGRIGVGLFRGAGLRAARVNLRASLTSLLEGHGPIGRRLGPFTDATPVTGAPLRTSLEGTSASRPGLTIIGEAAGTTYAATGEGIGKAMESALLLDEIAATGAVDLPSFGIAHREALHARFRARFRAYAVAQRWIAFPRFVDYVTERAADSPYIRTRLSEFLAETDLPTRVFSTRGVWRLMTAR